MNSNECPRVPNFGCHIQMESLFGKSNCLTCGREWEAMTPKGSENHCVRELGSRLEAAEAELTTLRAKLAEAERAIDCLRISIAPIAVGLRGDAVPDPHDDRETCPNWLQKRMLGAARAIDAALQQGSTKGE